MRVISLLYHDVIEGDPDESGLSGAGAAVYKLSPAVFEDHLAAIAGAVRIRPVTAPDLLRNSPLETSVLFTFDDGGKSAYTHIAGRLEARGLKGHFLITAQYIGAPSFVTPEQIRALRDRGHVIGSHSYSHPNRMSILSAKELDEEWGTSVKILSDILGEQVDVASVPGGYFSRKVAQSAAAMGIRVLFTSEPRADTQQMGGCLVLGRYSIKTSTSPSLAAAYASDQALSRWKQAVFWNVKKVAKSLGGEFYIKARRAILSRR